VNISTRGQRYVVERRYTDFEELHKQVLSELNMLVVHFIFVSHCNCCSFIIVS